MRFDIRTLQQGNKILGYTEGENVGLTKNSVGAITTAYIMWLAKKLDKPVFTLKICTGSDNRPSSQELKEGVMTGVQMTGSRNYDAGFATTDAVAVAPIMPYFEFDGSIMVTGGKEDSDINGLQYFTAEGPVDEDTIAKMLDKAYKFAFIGEWHESEPVNVMQMYAAQQRMDISMDLEECGGNLKGMKIVVDAGNGVGGYYATEVLEKLGADISGSINLEADGTFPNGITNSNNAELIQKLIKTVIKNEADLGILFDVDAGSFAAVDSDGNKIITEECNINDVVVKLKKSKG